MDLNSSPSNASDRCLVLLRHLSVDGHDRRLLDYPLLRSLIFVDFKVLAECYSKKNSTEVSLGCLELDFYTIQVNRMKDIALRHGFYYDITLNPKEDLKALKESA